MGPQLDSCGKRRPFLDSPHSEYALQWGRNLIVAERRYLSASFSAAVRLQWGRNLIVAESGVPHEVDPPLVASMGPQLDSCGKFGLLHLA